MINMDFSKAVVVDTTEQPWVRSPNPGVWRKPLAREEAEQGHVTSIVKFEPGASFHEHGHPGGEEILVLDGVFSDQTGDYPAGSYCRNPDGFRHAPFSREGCVALVKLHQFQADDKKQLAIDTNSTNWLASGDGRMEILPLHQHNAEQVFLVRLPAGERPQPHEHDGGEEIYVISGELIDEHGRYPAGSWVRCPHMSYHSPHVEQDTLLWAKIGHLS